MEIKFKKLCPEAVIPTKGSKGAAGFDLTAVTKTYNRRYGVWEYGTGIAVEIPEGYEGELRSRSSIFKTGLVQSNCVGTIDSDYRGEIMVKFYDAIDNNFDQYNVGDRVAQLLIKKVEDPIFVEVSELSDTERGTGGYGSTGR